jgi:hypothetical protein
MQPHPVSESISKKNSHRQSLVKLTKLLIAGFLIAGLTILAAQDLAPNMSYANLFAYLFWGLAVLAVSLVGVSVIYLTIYQWILRKGGTDTAWFWFSSEPKGLMALRESLRRD